MTTNPTAIAPLSLIQALHQRWEATQREGTAIENAQIATNNDVARDGRLDRASRANEADGDTLRYAILTQVPDGKTDLLILTYHVRLEHDFQANIVSPFGRTDPRPGILSNAIDAMLDFIARDFGINLQAIGPQMQDGCATVSHARRYRTGETEV
ncbi:hypothetical protein ACFOKI_07745 [Sphingomonas qilianensis]|uniref:Uncharacterized protein n=1 Tax=Sphingomonas qilianensis TaxID=1736690 RepID=A0ABU9XWS7_9SPHN